MPRKSRCAGILTGRTLIPSKPTKTTSTRLNPGNGLLRCDDYPSQVIKMSISLHPDEFGFNAFHGKIFKCTWPARRCEQIEGDLFVASELQNKENRRTNHINNIIPTRRRFSKLQPAIANHPDKQIVSCPGSVRGYSHLRKLETKRLHAMLLRRPAYLPAAPGAPENYCRTQLTSFWTNLNAYRE